MKVQPRDRIDISEVDLSSALAQSWERNTSFDPSRWSKNNPAWGQCAVSALVVQDVLGGQLLVGKVNGIDHYWNVLPNMREVDFTRQQFGEVRSFEGPTSVEREYVLSFSNTLRRYHRLRRKVVAKLAASSNVNTTRRISSATRLAPDHTPIKEAF